MNNINISFIENILEEYEVKPDGMDKDDFKCFFQGSDIQNMISQYIKFMAEHTWNDDKQWGLGHNIGHSAGWVERSETQQLIDVGFRSSTQPTGNSYGLKYDPGPNIICWVP